MGLPRKKVRFPEEEEQVAKVVCEVPCREDFTEEELALIFFTKDDYFNTRQVTKKISRDCERQGFGKRLDDTFTEKSVAVQEKLNFWALHGQERRGLERWSNRDHGEKRQQEQFQAVMTVLQAQDEMLAESREVDAEKLRKVSHKATKAARHFARMMGKADMYAVENEELADKFDADAESIKTASTGVSTVSTVADDDISLPRIPDDLKDSKHTNKSRKLYSRLPNFLTRGRGKKEESPFPLKVPSCKV